MVRLKIMLSRSAMLDLLLVDVVTLVSEPRSALKAERGAARKMAPGRTRNFRRTTWRPPTNRVSTCSSQHELQNRIILSRFTSETIYIEMDNCLRWRTSYSQHIY